MADYMIPTSVKEVKALGWDYIDVIISVVTPLWTTLLSGLRSSPDGFRNMDTVSL